MASGSQASCAATVPRIIEVNAATGILDVDSRKIEHARR
jgi:hypothetical protein